MHTDNEIDYLLKLVIIGDSGVGKTNLLSRFINNSFDENNHNTIGVDFSAYDLTINNKSVKVQFWDTAGQEKYKSIASAYYKNAQGAIIVYDITQRPSFDNVSSWYNELKQYSDPDIQIMILGNKTDLNYDRQVQKSEGLKYSEAKNAFFMEVSGKTNENASVNKAFMMLIEDIVNKQENEYHQNFEDDALSLNSKGLSLGRKNGVDEEKKGCC